MPSGLRYGVRYFPLPAWRLPSVTAEQVREIRARVRPSEKRRRRRGRTIPETAALRIANYLVEQGVLPPMHDAWYDLTFRHRNETHRVGTPPPTVFDAEQLESAMRQALREPSPERWWLTFIYIAQSARSSTLVERCSSYGGFIDGFVDFLATTV